MDRAGDRSDSLTPATQRLILRGAIVLAAAWAVALIAMWLLTANPVVVSEPQIIESTAVVTGKVLEGGRDRIEVQRVWFGEVAPGEISIANLQEVAGLQPGDERIFPLKHFGTGYRITTLTFRPAPQLPLQSTLPLVYPSTWEATDQVKAAIAKAGVRK